MVKEEKNVTQFNERILNCIKEICKDKPVIADFLIDLIYEEIENPGAWRWRDTYRKKIMQFLEREESIDEV